MKLKKKGSAYMKYEELIGKKCYYFEGNDETVIESTINETNVNWVSKNIGDRVFLNEKDAYNKLFEISAA